MRTTVLLQVFLFTLLLAVFSGGCQKNSTSQYAMKAAAAAAKPVPEQSFDVIMESFRHSMEDNRIGFVMHDKGGHSMMVGQRKVSQELIRPATEEETYKAIITVTSESRYSMKRSPGETQDEDKKQDSEQDIANIVDDTTDPNGIEILDSNLVSKPGGAAPRKSVIDSGKSMVARRPDVDIRKYELVYEGGRWVLVTQLDLKTELSIQHAFEIALKTQS